MKPVYAILIGVLTLLGSMWGGAYTLEYAPAWARFPGFMTAITGGVCGWGAVIYGLHAWGGSGD